MFKLICTHEQQSNYGSSLYEVNLSKQYTVKEFIEEVLDKRKNEWGSFGIYSKDNPFRGNPICEYRGGRLISTFPDEILSSEIESITADGSWTLMNYVITLKHN